jgi:outer membrane biosynthesis protein TonB
LPEPDPSPPPPAAAAQARPTPKRAAKRIPKPAEPTPAPALLTAAEQPTNAAPVRFATDPNGRGYASGLVAANGTAAPRPEPATQPLAAATITPADQLQRQPTWLGDDCHGYFPDQAQSDLGEVALVALVRPDGSVARLDMQSERPANQGFARAARACLQHQRFDPALDRKGNTTLARTLIRLRFSR